MPLKISRLKLDYKPVENASSRRSRPLWAWGVAGLLAGGLLVALALSNSPTVQSQPISLTGQAASVGSPSASMEPAVAESISLPIPAEPNKAHAPTPSGDGVQTGSKTISLRIQRGNTLAGLFTTNDLNYADLHAMLVLGKDTKPLAQIHPGDRITIQYAPGSGDVLHLSYPYDEEHTLNIERLNNRFVASINPRPVQRSVTWAHGTIANSLFVAATNAGLSDNVTMQLINIFGWDIDFVHDIRAGDSFSVIYEKIYRDGEGESDGPILAAEFTTQGHTYKVVRYTDVSGHTDYYTPDGHSVRKAFLRAPVDFTRISSRFTLHRKHPILGYTRAHKGVDYAAPRGTPIKAAGDGRIILRRRDGGYGNCVMIRHGRIYTTVYGHMSHFKSGLHVGSYVHQGQIIGYVGMTGLATGPHLHFEMRVNGIPRNPRTVKLPDAAPIAAKYREAFEQHALPILAQLDFTNGGTQIAESTTTTSSTTAK